MGDALALAVGTLILVLRPSFVLNLVLPAGAPAAAYATKYLRLRSLSLIPALVSAVGFAAFRGMLDTVTPLKVSVASNALNLALDPVLIFLARMGVAGAALATAASETLAGLIYVALLLRRKLLTLGRLLKPPKLAALLPLIKGGSAMLLRQAALNVAFVSATRMTQAMDTTGVAAAVYSITNTLYSLGLVVMLAIQATGATLVPSALAKGGTEGADDARRVADRLIGWSTCIAAVMALGQVLTIPYLVPLFSTLPEVRSAVARPAMVSALVQLSNGPLFAGEGILMGVGGFGFLAALTSLGVAVMVAGLTVSSRLGLGVSSVWFSLLAFHAVQLCGVMFHHLHLGPLARWKVEDGGRESIEGVPQAAAGDTAPLTGSVECVELPVVGEVCINAEVEATVEVADEEKTA